MKSRLDQRHDNRLPSALSRLRRDVDELQQNQLVGGDSVAVTQNQTSAAWDILNDAIPATTDKQYRITFTPTSAIKPYADIQFIPLLEGNNGFEKIQTYPDFAFATDDTKRTWILAVSTSTVDIVLSVKFYIESIDTGTIGVAAI